MEVSIGDSIHESNDADYFGLYGELKTTRDLRILKSVKHIKHVVCGFCTLINVPILLLRKIIK